MKKKIFLLFVLAALPSGRLAQASLEQTLYDIDFKELCKGEGGSQDLGETTLNSIDNLVSNINKQISDLKALLDKNPKNPAAKNLSAQLSIIDQDFITILQILSSHLSEGCFLSTSAKPSHKKVQKRTSLQHH